MNKNLQIMVLGAAGMAGHLLVDYLRNEGYTGVSGVARRAAHSVDYMLDLSDFPAFEKLCTEISPDVIVNCAGVLIEDSATDFKRALTINAGLPHYVAALCAGIGARLIHVSTDCVFSGNSGSYSEFSLKDGRTPYAISKSCGEINNTRDLTIRTSLIGPQLKHGRAALLDWFLGNEQVEGYSNSIWSGVTTLELARFIEYSIHVELSGLYNLTNGQPISKYDLLHKISKAWGTQKFIVDNPGPQTNKSLITERSDVKFNTSSYDRMLAELHDWVSKHDSLYG